MTLKKDALDVSVVFEYVLFSKYTYIIIQHLQRGFNFSIFYHITFVPCFGFTTTFWHLYLLPWYKIWAIMSKQRVKAGFKSESGWLEICEALMWFWSRMCFHLSASHLLSLPPVHVSAQVNGCLLRHKHCPALMVFKVFQWIFGCWMWNRSEL